MQSPLFRHVSFHHAASMHYENLKPLGFYLLSSLFCAHFTLSNWHVICSQTFVCYYIPAGHAGLEEQEIAKTIATCRQLSWHTCPRNEAGTEISGGMKMQTIATCQQKSLQNYDVKLFSQMRSVSCRVFNCENTASLP